MGLSAGAIYISEADVAKDVAMRVGLLKPGARPLANSERGFEVDDGIRLGRVAGDWSVILVSPDALLQRMEGMSDALNSVSTGRKVLFWYVQSSSGGCIFEFHEDGVLRRRWVESEGQVFEDVGESMPEEAGLVDRESHEAGPIHSEWTVLELAERVSGIPIDAHFEMDGEVYAPALAL